MFFYYALSYLPYLLAILFAFCLCLYAVALYHRPGVAIGAILLLFIWETMEVQLFAMNMGIAVYPQDLVFGGIGLVAGIRLLISENRKRVPLALWVLTGAMFLSFVLGLAQNGTLSGVEFRPDFYLLAGTAYFLTFEWSLRKVENLIGRWCWLACGIILVTIYRWIADATGLDWVEPIWRMADSTGVAFRVVNSSQTFVLGQALIFLVAAAVFGRVNFRGWLWLVPVSGLVVLVLQHRSVWVAAFLPVLLVAHLGRKARTGGSVKLMPMIAAAVIVVAPLLVLGKLDSVASSVADSASKATSTSGGTFVGRVQGWDALLSEWVHSGPRQYLIGNPYGSGFARHEAEGSLRSVAFAPHNYYIQTLLRSGLFGLISLVSLYVLMIKRFAALRSEEDSSFVASTWIALLIGHLLFFIPYSPQYIQSIVLGIGLGILAGSKRLESAKRENHVGVTRRQNSRLYGAKSRIVRKAT